MRSRVPRDARSVLLRCSRACERVPSPVDALHPRRAPARSSPALAARPLACDGTTATPPAMTTRSASATVERVDHRRMRLAPELAPRHAATARHAGSGLPRLAPRGSRGPRALQPSPDSRRTSARRGSSVSRRLNRVVNADQIVGTAGGKASEAWARLGAASKPWVSDTPRGSTRGHAQAVVTSHCRRWWVPGAPPPMVSSGKRLVRGVQPVEGPQRGLPDARLGAPHP